LSLCKKSFFRQILGRAPKLASAFLRGKFAAFLFIGVFTDTWARAEDGYRLWLRYDLITNVEKLGEYKAAFTAINMKGAGFFNRIIESRGCSSVVCDDEQGATIWFLLRSIMVTG
jgi:hypothetical protein